MSENVNWHQDDEFWTEMAPFMFGQDAWEDSSKQLSQALALMGLESPALVLDLACGPGRHSLEMARRGFRVTGVDRTTEYLEEARKRAKVEDLTIEFVQEDMRAIFFGPIHTKAPSPCSHLLVTSNFHLITNRCCLTFTAP